MILSVSRRTDIPAYYMEWFWNRLKERSVLVRNPMNYHQVSQIDLSPEVIDCIVFWSKNPKPLLDYTERLSSYPYYVQFTINPYGEELESRLPSKEELIQTFLRMSESIGPQRMVWRYSPMLLNDKYTQDLHLEAFQTFAERLRGYTLRCNMSFIEMYSKIQHQMKRANIGEIEETNKIRLVRKLRQIAEQNQIELRACGNLDLQKAEILAAKCIDDELISHITGKSFELKKDKNQDQDCYCVSSIDIGAYNTCLNGCLYCYANQANPKSTYDKSSRYQPESPLLCSTLLPGDMIKKRSVKAEGSDQLRMPF